MLELPQPEIPGISEINTLEQEPPEVIPSKNDPKWHDYVLSLLTKDELLEGKPTTDGLRRLIHLVGTVIRSEVCVLEPVKETNLHRLTPVTVTYTMEVITNDGVRIVYTDAAQVCAHNTNDEFLRFGVETAATRAEGRVLRKLLGLRKTVTFEEADAPNIKDVDMSGNIRPEQINFLDVLCSRNQIDVIKYVNSGSHKYKSVTDISYEKACEMIRHLSKLEKHPEEIKDDIKGYDHEWQNRAF